MYLTKCVLARVLARVEVYVSISDGLNRNTNSHLNTYSHLQLHKLNLNVFSDLLKYVHPIDFRFTAARDGRKLLVADIQLE